MTPLREWLKPPKSLLLILFLLTLVSVCALGWCPFTVSQTTVAEGPRTEASADQEVRSWFQRTSGVN